MGMFSLLFTVFSGSLWAQDGFLFLALSRVENEYLGDVEFNRVCFNCTNLDHMPNLEIELKGMLCSNWPVLSHPFMLGINITQYRE